MHFLEERLVYFLEKCLTTIRHFLIDHLEKCFAIARHFFIDLFEKRLATVRHFFVDLLEKCLAAATCSMHNVGAAKCCAMNFC